MKSGDSIQETQLKSFQKYEEIIEESRIALEVCEERYRKLYENNMVGIYRTTPDGQILMANPALVKMLGFTSFEELADRNLEIKYYGPEYSRDDFKERIEAQGSIIGWESIWTKKDGSKLFIRENAWAAKDKKGNILYYEGTLEDITDKKKGEEEREILIRKLEKTNRELIRANRIKDEILANTGHELRTPLNVIIGLTNLIKDGLFENENELFEFIEVINTNSQYLLTTINEILELAQIGSGNLIINYSKVDVTALFKDIREKFHNEIEEKSLDFKILFPNDTCNIIESDWRRLNQILSILLANAIKFTPSGSIELAAEANKDKHLMLFRVEDSGIGINPDAQKDIFKPFFQQNGSTTRRYKGIGVGLAVCKDLIELMGGEIWLENQGEIKGTKICFTIPVSRIASE